jgi:hypothetical protein
LAGLPLSTEDELVQAERHVTEAEERCAWQAALIERLIAHNHPQAVPRAERLLATLERTRDLMRQHRDALLRYVSDTPA